LTKPEPELTEPERKQVKVTAKKLLEHITDKLVLDWRKRQQTRAAVQMTVNQILDEGLPEAYGPELYDEKCQQVFEHIYASYFDNGSSVYTVEVEEPPPVVPVGAFSSEPNQVTEVLIGQARSDPQVFARVMEELFGTQDTWFRPTEALLADDETRTVEYKQTARWNVKERRKDRAVEQVIVKTVAGFLNGRGGTLLIGVTDDRRPVGLDDDYELVRPRNADGYVGWLDTMLENALGHVGAHRVEIRIDVIKGCDICRIDVPASTRPIWVEASDGALVLYERRNNSTRAVPDNELDAFMIERFPARTANVAN
jgi:type I restriction enzyme, R subunit